MRPLYSMGKLIDLVPRRTSAKALTRELQLAIQDRDHQIAALHQELLRLKNPHRDRQYGLGLAILSFLTGMGFGLLLAGL